jgi:hypothetical protein
MKWRLIKISSQPNYDHLNKISCERHLSDKIIHMQSTISHNYAHTFPETRTRISIWKKFIRWSDGQQEKRFEWLAIGLVGHGCIITILTACAVLFTGNNFIFWPFIIGAMTMTLVSNLAALPTKITIPVLFISVLIDIAVIIAALSHGFNFEAVYR